MQEEQHQQSSGLSAKREAKLEAKREIAIAKIQQEEKEAKKDEVKA